MPMLSSSSLESPGRLGAVAASGLLDSPPEKRFDRLTRLAARSVGAPVALLSVLDRDRQFLKSAEGLCEHWAGRREIPLSHSICKHVIASGEPLASSTGSLARLAVGHISDPVHQVGRLAPYAFAELVTAGEEGGDPGAHASMVAGSAGLSRR